MSFSASGVAVRRQGGRLSVLQSYRLGLAARSVAIQRSSSATRSSVAIADTKQNVRKFSSVRGPIPYTRCDSSTEQKSPCSIRSAMIRLASTGPTPGTNDNSFALASLRSIRMLAVRPAGSGTDDRSSEKTIIINVTLITTMLAIVRWTFAFASGDSTHSAGFVMLGSEELNLTSL